MPQSADRVVDSVGAGNVGVTAGNAVVVFIHLTVSDHLSAAVHGQNSGKPDPFPAGVHSRQAEREGLVVGTNEKAGIRSLRETGARSMTVDLDHVEIASPVQGNLEFVGKCAAREGEDTRIVRIRIGGGDRVVLPSGNRMLCPSAGSELLFR